MLHPFAIFPLALGLALSGCQKPAADFGLEAAPILPAPDAPRYAVAQGTPKDPLVAQVVASGLPWDESLSGAATALVLDDEHEPSLVRAHWAAIRSGYPYPVVGLTMGEVPAGEPPDGLATSLEAQLGPGAHLGLVRARVSVNKDRWLALIGQSTGTLTDFPREIEVGEVLQFDLAGGGSFRVLSPSGWQATQELPHEAVLNEAGEWWYEVVDLAGRPVANIPVHVGMATPKSALLEIPGDVPESAAEIALWVLEDLNEIRRAFDRPPLQADSTLATLAAVPLDKFIQGTWDRASGESRLQGAGFVGGAVVQAACTGTTVATCLDGLLRTVDGRAALLHPDVRLVGHAAELRTDGLSLLLNLASE
jgi:hypothetical protein